MNFRAFLRDLCWKAATLSRPLMAVDGAVFRLDGAPPVMAALAVMADKGVYYLVDVVIGRGINCDQAVHGEPLKIAYLNVHLLYGARQFTTPFGRNR
jgi:hypothetical protein